MKGLRLGLRSKLLLGFAAVVLAGIGTVSLLANQTTAREVHGYMFRGGMGAPGQITDQLAAYYRGRGSWQGVESLASGGLGLQAMGGMMGSGPVLADASGRVLVGPGNGSGTILGPGALASASPITVDGNVVGYLLPGAGLSGTSTEQALIGRLNRAIWLAALFAAVAALLVGSLLVAGILRPVRELTEAARAISLGELTRRVPVRTSDELGILAQSFNQMAANLDRGEALRREMTADVAHELRTPLAVMQARVEAVIDGVFPASKENLEPILAHVVVLNRLVDDLRTLALADAEQLVLERTRLDLAVWLPRVVEARRSEADAAAIDLGSRVPDAPVAAEIDPIRMEQVMGNLLSNALRHTPPKGSILVTLARRHDERALIQVIDSGEGIPSEDLPLVFERFYRGDGARSRKTGGTGLGLAIARKLIEAHGGNVSVGNQPSGGAVFTIDLPILASDPITPLTTD